MNLSDGNDRLNYLLNQSGIPPLDPPTQSQFEAYVSLFIRWNDRINLSAIRSEDEILSRHIVESIIVARSLPAGIHSLLDFGSGGGLPGIPIALCRPEIAVTLAESQNKKAAFLQEALRILGIKARVYSARAETLLELFDCVILRAVDRMPKAVAAASKLAGPKKWLALMTTVAELPQLQSAAGEQFSWAAPVRLPGSDARILALGKKISS
jgi:16S rRNA (guanine527-N7)-methyltransferase